MKYALDNLPSFQLYLNDSLYFLYSTLLSVIDDKFFSF